MVPTGGKKCLRFCVDKKNEKQFCEFLMSFLKTFGDDVMFHRPLRDEDGVFITFLFPDGNDDRLIEFLWELVRFFNSGTYCGVEKVSFLMGGKAEIKLHPIGIAVS